MRFDAEGENNANEETIPEYYVYVNAPDGYVNLRTGSGTEYDIICSIPNGEALVVYCEEAKEKSGRKWLEAAYNTGSNDGNP